MTMAAEISELLDFLTAESKGLILFLPRENKTEGPWATKESWRVSRNDFGPLY